MISLKPHFSDRDLRFLQYVTRHMMPWMTPRIRIMNTTSPMPTFCITAPCQHTVNLSCPVVRCEAKH